MRTRSALPAQPCCVGKAGLRLLCSSQADRLASEVIWREAKVMLTETEPLYSLLQVAALLFARFSMHGPPVEKSHCGLCTGHCSLPGENRAVPAARGPCSPAAR